jgi:hypothetical protein
MGGSGGSYSGGGYSSGGKPKTGGGAGGGLGGGDGGGSACDISLDATLASPVPGVVGTLSVGDILSVNLNATGAAPIVEVTADTGAVAGTLAGLPNLRTLIQCLQDGVAYEFEVTSITGGRVEGRLRNA